MQHFTRQDIDAVIFDLGGVLIEIDFQRVFNRWAEYAGCDVEEITKRYSLDLHYEKHERGEIHADEYFASLRDSLGLYIDNAQFIEGWNRIFVGEVPNIRHIVEQYAALFPVFVFSNTNKTHKTTWMNLYPELLKPFKRVFISCDLGKRKPEVEAYWQVAAAIGVAPHRILFFDDSAQNIEGARQAGMIACKVDTVADVQQVLKRLSAQ
jgi:epoxide hydrolase-like predicted phosphatase